MSKVSPLREMSSEQLSLELEGARKSLFTLRFQAASERNDAPSQAKRLRRRIAQILTVQRQQNWVSPEFNITQPPRWNDEKTSYWNS